MTERRIAARKKFSMRLLPRSVLGGMIAGKKGAVRRFNKSGVRGLEGFTVSRSATTGQFIINGVPESELVNKFPSIEISKASINPNHLTLEQIRKIVAAMKVAS
jgi:hypothetical protein